MTDDKLEKKKKPGRKPSKTDESLAAEILAQAKADALEALEKETADQEDTPEVPYIPEIEEVKAQTDSKNIPGTKDTEAVETPKRRVLTQGISKQTAFKINRRIDEVASVLGGIFGYLNGDYFISNENTATYTVNNQRRRYKCLRVEDKFNFTYIIWFDITSLGPVY